MLKLKDISTLTYTEDGVTYTADHAHYDARFKMYTCKGCDLYNDATSNCSSLHESKCDVLGVVWKKPKQATYYYIENNMKFISKPATRNSCLGCYFADEDDCKDRAVESQCVERDVVWLKVDHFHPPMHDYVVSSNYAQNIVNDVKVDEHGKPNMFNTPPEEDYYVLDIRDHYLDSSYCCNDSAGIWDYWSDTAIQEISNDIRVSDVDRGICSVSNGNNSTELNMEKRVTYSQDGKNFVGVEEEVKHTCTGCYFNPWENKNNNLLSEDEIDMACDKSDCNDHRVIWKHVPTQNPVNNKQPETTMKNVTYTENGEDFIGVKERSCDGCYFNVPYRDCYSRKDISRCSEHHVVWQKVPKSTKQEPTQKSVGTVSITYVEDGVTYNGVHQEGVCDGCAFLASDRNRTCYTNTKCGTFSVIWKKADDKPVDQNVPKDKPIEQRDQIIEQLREMLLQRSQTGIKKYGTTLERTDLTSSEWCQHFLEELLDASGYILRLKADLQALGK